MSYQAPKIPSQVSVRVDVAMRNKAEGIRRCWNAIAHARAEDLDDEGNEVEIEPAHVYRSCLEQRLDEETATLTGGQGFPRLDDEKAWEQLLKAVVVGVANAKPKAR